MGKRTRSVAAVDTDSEYAEDSDASFRLSNKKTASRPRKATQPRKRAVTKPLKHDTELTPVSEDDIDPTDGHSVAAAPHAASRHVISDPMPPRKALLNWYAGVHESRGMPWRKPYNPTLDRDQRAQRAYEVCPAALHAVVRGVYHDSGLDLRDNAPADAGRHRHTVLQQVDGQVRSSSATSFIDL